MSAPTVPSDPGAPRARRSHSAAAAKAPAAAEPAVPAPASPSAARARPADTVAAPVAPAAAPPPNDSEIAKAFLIKYRPEGDHKVSRPFERLLVVANRLDALVADAKTPTEVAERMVAKDIRRHIFLLEGALRLYKKQFSLADTERLTAALADMKELEDTLGDTTYPRNILASARDNGAPPAVIADMEAKDRAAFGKLVELVTAKWTPDAKDGGRLPGLKAFFKTVDKVDFGSYGEDQKRLLTKIAKEVAAIPQGTYDLNDLHNGIHELRRQIRWIPVYVEATGGMIQLSENLNPIDSIKSILGDPLAQSKYIKLPGTFNEKAPVMISKAVYTDVMKAVLDLGAVKDDGEHLEELAASYLSSGSATDEKDAYAKARTLLKLDGKDDLTARSQVVVDHLKDTQLLETLAQNLSALAETEEQP